MAALVLQVASGLFTDDEIAFAGPLTSLVSGDWVSRATTWHKGWGQYLVIGLVVLHVLAIIIYRLRRHDLVTPMLHGDKPLAGAVPAARDSVGTRLLALVLLAVCAGVVYAVVQLGHRPMLG